MKATENPWKVTSNPVGDKYIYGVYRFIDPNEVDHSGNREFYGEYLTDKQEAIALAEKLNEEDIRKSPLKAD